VTESPIVIVGAGPGGICTAVKLKQAGINDFVILERSEGLGGTWFNNRYPGLACDVPSLLYCFSFDQKHDWSRPYAPQPEILEYLRQCATRHGVVEHIIFDQELVAARWDDQMLTWSLLMGDGSIVSTPIFISAIGTFHTPNWPDIPGLDDFRGHIVHPAVWPDDLLLDGKKVGIIGTAASAVQLVPEVAKVAEELVVYQRSANWVFPKDDDPYNAAQLAEMVADPTIGLGIRRETLDHFEAWLTWDAPDLLEDLRQRGLENIELVHDPSLRLEVTPTVPVGAQRPLFSNDYYPTFNLPSVHLVTTPIERVTEAAVRDATGQEHQHDVLMLATGYQAYRYLTVLDEVTGRDGASLDSVWHDGPQAYKGITIAGFPNLFMLYGPNTNTGSILSMLEIQADYIAGKIRYLRDHGVRAMDVRAEVMTSYNDEIQDHIAKVEVWQVPGGSKYYRSSSGRLVTQWPLNMAAYAQRTAEHDIGHLELLYVDSVAGSPSE
jgi:cation diffusion facilitator CzcD-associated flavoprotein CzcO